MYAISEEKPGDIHVTKTRDLNHCQEEIIKDMGLAYTERCTKCQQVPAHSPISAHVYECKMLDNNTTFAIAGLGEHDRINSTRLHPEVKR